ncbi:MAG: cation-translocating P-type ATPase, partial [Muribaculaceae bacterium]
MVTVMLAVTLIVVSVPEGLPMSVTLSLALSMRRMLQSNNLVRKMHACETMGATTIICTDKTGTLTQNRMQVWEAQFYGLREHCRLSADDEESRIISEAISCNSTAFLDCSNPEKTVALGNPTEGALLLWLKDAGCDYLEIREQCEVLAQVPFSTERKYMATVVRSKELGCNVLYVKGAPEIVYGLCTSVTGDVAEAEIRASLAGYQAKAMRTLGFARQLLNEGEMPIVDGRLTECSLRFTGIVAISDPVRSDVPDAIGECLEAGIRVKIVTGDTPGTAREIGRQVGLWTDSDTDDCIITGPEFAALGDDEAAERARKIKIMSRARPGDKSRLVNLLQQQGEVVAVTGDGTNDAPALNAAQVGLSMGDGTSVAKEASDITIMDNSFASITKAVMWGRSLYKNIQRFIIFQLTVNVAACVLVAVVSFLSEKQPALTVTQMLWVNLIMDTFAALALASLPPSEEVMNDKPRNNKASIITPAMARFILGIGLFFAIIMTGLFVYMLIHNVGGNAGLMTTKISMEERTIFFTTFVFMQFWNIFNARSFGSGHSAFHNMRES